MISHTGRYWSTGIIVRWNPDRGWSATLPFFDDGFANDRTDSGRVSTEGELHTRYAVRDGSTANGLTVAVDTLLADAGRLGIELIGDPIHGPQLYYWGDGEAKDYPPPAGWREILAAEAERIGWQPAYLPSRQEGVAR